jgi:hypothetical protein
MSSRVFIPSIPMYRNPDTGEFEVKVDLSPAERYGQIVTLLDGDVYPFRTDLILAAFKAGLATYTDHDYILLAGTPLQLAIIGGIATTINDGRVKFLRWQSKRKAYEVVPVDMWKGWR